MHRNANAIWIGLVLLCLFVVAGVWWVFLRADATVSPHITSMPNKSTPRAGNEALGSSNHSRTEQNREQDDGERFPSDFSVQPRANEGSSSAGGSAETPTDNKTPGSGPQKATPWRWNVPKLDWKLDSKLGRIEDKAETTAPSSGTDPWEWPANTIGFRVHAYDGMLGGEIRDADVEIVDSNGRLRVRGAIGKQPNTPASRNFFTTVCPEPGSFLIRVQAGAQRGFATVGFGSGSPGGKVYLEATESRFAFHVTVLLFSPEQAQTVFAVVDADGQPIPDSTIYMEVAETRCILGQADDAGHVRISCPMLESAPAAVATHWVRPLIVAASGKVPVVLRLGDLDLGAANEIRLAADEVVVEFTLLLSRGTALNGLYPWSEGGGISAFEVDRGVFSPNANAEELLATVHGNVRRLGYASQPGVPLQDDNSKALVAAVGRVLFESARMQYDRWYARQWYYEPGSGIWQVVLPHAGRYVIAINEEHREYYDSRGDEMTKGSVMDPGLLVDATNPVETVASFVYP